MDPSSVMSTDSVSIQQQPQQGVMTVEEIQAVSALQAMEAEQQQELKQLDELASKLGLTEEHVLEMECAYRAWDIDADGYISVDDVKRLLYTVHPELPIHEQNEVAPLFKMARITYHSAAKITRARFLQVLLTIVQWSYVFLDGLDLRVLPMSNDQERILFHQRILKVLSQGARPPKIDNDLTSQQITILNQANTLLKEFEKIRQMLRASQQEYIEKGLDCLSKMLAFFNVCNSSYERQSGMNVQKTLFHEKSGIPWNRVSDILLTAPSAKFQYLCLQILVYIAKMIYIPGTRLQNPYFDKLFSQSLCQSVYSRIVKNKNAHQVVRAAAIQMLGICSVREGVCGMMLRNGIVSDILTSLNEVKESDENTVRVMEAVNVYSSWVTRNPALREHVIPLLSKLCQQILSKSVPEVILLTAMSLRHLLTGQTLNLNFVESLIQTMFSSSDPKTIQTLAGCIEIAIFQAKIKFPDQMNDKETARLHLLQKFANSFGSNKLALSHSFDIIRRLFEEEDIDSDQMSDIESSARSVSQTGKIIGMIIEKSSILMPYDIRCRRLVKYLSIKRTHFLEDVIPDLVYSLATYLAHTIQSNTVLRQVYQYSRMDLNHVMAFDLYDSIDAIFSFLLSKEDSSDLVQKVNTSFITHIETFLPSVSGNNVILFAFEKLLFKIRDAYTQKLTRVSEVALQKLDIVMSNFHFKAPVMSMVFPNVASFSNQSYSIPLPSLRVMLVYKNDISVIPTNTSSILYEELLDVIRQKYGRDLVPKYNYRGTLISVENQHSLDRALSNSNREVLRLELFDSRHSSDFSIPQSLHNDGYIAYLGKKYKIDINILKQLRSDWLSVTPNNYMTRDLFMISLASGSGDSQDPAFAEFLFSGMDLTKSGGINFESWVQGVAMLKGKNYQSRLQFIFRALDRDGDGFISQHDLENVILLLQSIGTSPAVHHYLESMVMFFSRLEAPLSDLSFRDFHILVLRRMMPIPFEDLFKRVPQTTPRAGKKNAGGDGGHGKNDDDWTRGGEEFKNRGKKGQREDYGDEEKE